MVWLNRTDSSERVAILNGQSSNASKDDPSEPENDANKYANQIIEFSNLLIP